MPTMEVHKINNQVNECGILHAKTHGVTLEKSKKWACVKISHGPICNGIFQFFLYFFPTAGDAGVSFLDSCENVSAITFAEPST
jgi:hypothetical protein